MALVTVMATAPSHWACYLINGDADSLDLLEQTEAIAFVNWLGAWPVGLEDAGFMWTHDATRFGVGGADCCTYTALVEVTVQ